MDKMLDVFELYADTDSRKIEKFNSKVNSKLKVKVETDKPKIQNLWIQKMEDTLEYLDNILRAPTRLIVNEEEVVKIEKIKKVTVESIKHLSKNAGFIEEVEDNGDIKPGKLLNVFKEETFNTYENRFIYTLIQKMLTIIRKEKKRLMSKQTIQNKEHKTFNYKGNSYNGKDKVDIEILISAESEDDDIQAEKKGQLQRIRELEKEVMNLTLTATYQELERERVSLITPPLKKNNVLLKNVNFQYAVKLWDYLISDLETEEKKENETLTKEFTAKGKAKKYVDETFLLDYLILKNIEDPEVRSKHKKELIEKLVANMVERTIDVNQNITEEQLKNLVSKQFTIIKYKKQVTTEQIQDIFRKYISRYVKKINT